MTYFDAARARNGDDILSLSQEPGEGGLACSGAMARADFLEPVREAKDVWEVLRGIARRESTEVARWEVFWRALRCTYQ